MFFLFLFANINDKFIFNSVKEEIGKKIKDECSKIFPLQDNCMVRKVKLLKKPKFDLNKLMELYKNQPEETKAPVEASDATENKLAA